jgi:hypothetical protein
MTAISVTGIEWNFGLGLLIVDCVHEASELATVESEAACYEAAVPGWKRCGGDESWSSRIGLPF